MNIKQVGSPNFTNGRQGKGKLGFIILPNGSKMLYDFADEELVNKYRWQFSSGYARFQKEKRVDGKRVCERIYLHRLLTNAKEGEVVDHINGNTLDNRTSNLRITDKSGNAANSKVRVDNSSGFRGVTRVGSKWMAQANHKGKHHYLGVYKSVEQASAAASKFRTNNFKEFAR